MYVCNVGMSCMCVGVLCMYVCRVLGILCTHVCCVCLLCKYDWL